MFVTNHTRPPAGVSAFALSASRDTCAAQEDFIQYLEPLPDVTDGGRGQVYLYRPESDADPQGGHAPAIGSDLYDMTNTTRRDYRNAYAVAYRDQSPLADAREIIDAAKSDGGGIPIDWQEAHAVRLADECNLWDMIKNGGESCALIYELAAPARYTLHRSTGYSQGESLNVLISADEDPKNDEGNLQHIDHLVWDAPAYITLDIDGGEGTDGGETIDLTDAMPDRYDYDAAAVIAANKGRLTAPAARFLTENLPEYLSE